MTYSSYSFAMSLQFNQSSTSSGASFSGGGTSFLNSSNSFNSSINDPMASLFSGGGLIEGLMGNTGNPYDLGLSNYQPTNGIDSMFTLPNTQNYNNNSSFEPSFNFPPTQGNQCNQGNQAQNPMQMFMQFFMMMLQMFMQMLGMNPEQMGQMGELFNNGNNGNYGNNGVNGTNGTNGTNGSNNSGYVGSSNQPNAPVNSQGLSSPTSGRVTSEFGMRNHPISGGRKMHSGIDIAAPAGSRVNSMKGGTVVSAGQQGGYGNCIVVDHGNGLTTRYAHLSSINVRPGQSVSAGQKIGGVGSTGNSTGNHLHFEVRENGNAVNPRKYINA